MAIFSAQKLLESYEKAIKSAKEFLVISKKTNDFVKETAVNIAKFSKGIDTASAKGLKAFNVELEKANKLVKVKTENDKASNAAERDLIKTEQALTKAIIEEEKANQSKLKTAALVRAAEIKEVKEQERLAKASEKLVKVKKKELDQYQKTSKELNDLRKSYRSNFLETEKNRKGLKKYTFGFTKAGKEQKKQIKQITQLDKKLKGLDDQIGQNFRTVGKYENATKKLNNTIGKLGIVAIIAKGFSALTSSFGDSRDGALTMDIAMSKFTETAKVFLSSVIKSAGGIKELFSAFGDSFSSVGVKAELVALKIQRSLTWSDDGKASLTGQINVLNKELKELESSSVSNAIDKIMKAFEGNIETTSNAIASQEKYLELQLRTKISIEQQTKELAGLQEQRQILQDISDDDTLGFIAREKAVKDAFTIATKFAKLELKLALTKENLTVEAIKQDLRRSKALSEQQILAIKSGEQLKAVLLNENIARKVSDANDEAFSSAFIERRDKEVEAQSFGRDQEEKFRKTERDAFEQELDILEEFTEKKIASNTKIINSDKATIEERQAAQLENEKLEKELFERSIELIVDQGKASIDLRKDVTQAERDRQKALLDDIDLQKIIETQNAQEIFDILRRLDLGEIEEKRAKDSLKIKKDLTEANKDSALIEEEAALKTKEIQNELLLQEQKLAGKKIDLAKEQDELEKKRLENRIELLKKDSIERLELEKELNELKLKEQETSEKKISDDKKELIEVSTDFVMDQIERISDARQEAAQREIDQSIANQELIAQGIENGSKLGEQSLALEKKLQADRQLEIERLEQDALRLTALISLLQVWGQTGNLAETLAGFASIKTASKSLDGAFYEGSDNVGSTDSETKVHNGKDGYRAALHKGEMVFNDRQSDELRSMGFTTRDSMLDLARMSDYSVDKGGNVVNVVNDNQFLTIAIQEQNKLLRSLPKQMPVHNTGLSDNPKYIEEVIKKGNITKRTKQRATGTWQA
tara:strand:+ start:3543 stop:6518 length:2976 start_codon:yes stop_codon:yes gene_type:complete